MKDINFQKGHVLRIDNVMLSFSYKNKKGVYVFEGPKGPMRINEEGLKNLLQINNSAVYNLITVS